MVRWYMRPGDIHGAMYVAHSAATLSLQVTGKMKALLIKQLRLSAEASD